MCVCLLCHPHVLSPVEANILSKHVSRQKTMQTESFFLFLNLTTSQSFLYSSQYPNIFWSWKSKNIQFELEQNFFYSYNVLRYYRLKLD